MKKITINLNIPKNISNVTINLISDDNSSDKESYEIIDNTDYSIISSEDYIIKSPYIVKKDINISLEDYIDINNIKKLEYNDEEKIINPKWDNLTNKEKLKILDKELEEIMIERPITPSNLTITEFLNNLVK